MSSPLAGRRVIVTRAASQAAALVDLLASAGAEVLVFPTIEIVDPEDFEPVDEAIRHLDVYSWAIFTSANAVTRFFARMALADKDARHLHGLRVAAVGPATAAALERNGIRADFVPDEYVGEGVLELTGGDPLGGATEVTLGGGTLRLHDGATVIKDISTGFDNATGTAEVLEVARAFAKGPRPARTVVFALWTAEEKGLLGAEAYAANPIYPLAKTAAVINLDPHVVLPAARDIELVGGGRTDLEARLAEAASRLGLRVTPEPNPEAGWYFRSDHYPFAKKGVPITSAPRCSMAKKNAIRKKGR